MEKKLGLIPFGGKSLDCFIQYIILMKRSFELKRATTPGEFLQKMERFLNFETIEDCKAFKPKASDIIITTFPKSGTTWMQQIAHCLRSNGDMTFDEISIAVPWLEVSYDMGINLNDQQAFSPRLFKSHFTAEEVPKGAKYIVIFRDPGDVLLSYYNFMEGWFFEPGSISLEDFANVAFFETDGFENYWYHLRTWWAKKDDPNVLIFCYEDMKLNIDDVISSVAKFANIPISRSLLNLTKENSSHSFMKRNEKKFDEHRTQKAFNVKCRLPEGGNSSKVRSRISGLPPLSLTAKIENNLAFFWEREIFNKLGFRTYSDFRNNVT